ncbi:MAG: sigma-70 family RNA polymerase sigma factor [Planctomycetota bacterium]
MDDPRTGELLKHVDDLRRWAHHRTRDPHLAEDLVQEAVLHALVRLHEVREMKKVGAWLFRIAERRLADCYRRPRMEELPDRIASPPPDPEPVLPPERAAAQVKRGLRLLPGPLRRVVRLHYLQERPLSEVARRLGTSVGAVKSRLYRARRMMRESQP